jgi:hypothetical protein
MNVGPSPRVERSAVRVSSDASGLPPAGWYPDPSEWHGERFWDGETWTSRARDGTVEVDDPLPEARLRLATREPSIPMSREERKQQEKLAKDARRQAEQARKDRARYLSTPVGQAETAFGRGDLVFQYSLSVMSQAAIIVAMVGSATSKSTTDPSEVLNAVCRQGWELVTGSFVFVVEGEQSRDKFLASGQNVAVKGQTVGYYLFRRRPENCVA